MARGCLLGRMPRSWGTGAGEDSEGHSVSPLNHVTSRSSFAASVASSMTG